MKKFFADVLICGIVMCAVANARAQDPFQLTEGDVVTFVGGTNMVRLQQHGYLESSLTHSFATERPTFRDLAWESDTVFRQGSVDERWRNTGYQSLEDHTDGLGSLDKQLVDTGTTVVIAQFGQLESMSGRGELDRFVRAYEDLIDAYVKRARTIVLVTPIPFETPNGKFVPDLSDSNGDLELYVDAIATIAKARGLLLVDLFHGATADLTDNGMHVREDAHELLASRISRQLGLQPPPPATIKTLRAAVIEKHRLWNDYWRPANWKLLFGDDSKRQFTRGGRDYVPFREEWKRLLPLIVEAERRVWQIASGGDDPGVQRPDPEILHGAPEADVEQELASFRVLDGLEVNLFASEQDGLTSPLNLRWDPAGRMYVTVTTTYPHVFPGDLPNDKIIRLEDTDRDGVADKSTVFADGLNIPTGIEIGDGGVYVGQNTELLFLKDNDGDGQADQRRVVLSGFGNGDSHQTINSFVWGPGGEMYFGQGDGIESRVETPWGSADLYQSGFYRLRPRRLQMLPVLDDFKGPGNPWGVGFDHWGQIFSVDGAGGVSWLTAALSPTTHGPRYRTIGKPGGYCGIGYVDGRHLPQSMRGHFVIGDFKANRIKRFSVTQAGSGFNLHWQEPILQSGHRNFRPVDVKVGPDGAIYIVDWYNPITCHQDDAYRDPTRDKAHGRIWRVSSKSRPVSPPNLTTASIDKVLNALTSPEYWTRYQAKRELTRRETGQVAAALGHWVRSLDPQTPQYEHHLFEALGAYATIEVVEPKLLERLLAAADSRARAFATRIVSRWHDRLDDPLELLARSIADEDPLVRLEAVVGCTAVPSPRAVVVAASIVDKPMDSWIEYAWRQTVHHLQPIWIPAFRRGELQFNSPSHLAATLNQVGGKELLASLRQLVDQQTLDSQTRISAIAAILATGSQDDVYQFGLDQRRFTRSGQYDPIEHAAVLEHLVEVARTRDVQPNDDRFAAVGDLLNSDSVQVKTAALKLVGIWQLDRFRSVVSAIAQQSLLPVEVRAVAMKVMVQLQLPNSRQFLENHLARDQPPALRSAAIQALSSVDLDVAAVRASELIEDDVVGPQDREAILTAFLEHSGGADSLAGRLQTRTLRPQTAKKWLRSLFATGRTDQVLFDSLRQSIGRSASAAAFSEPYVSGLVDQAQKHGDAERGAVLFQSLACAACHQIGGVGGDIGPDLSAIGTTLSANRIVEELLWPNRQVKEGYSMIKVLTDSGHVHSGYRQKAKASDESGSLVLKDPATGKLTTIAHDQIEQHQVTGSAMPEGLTAVLSEPQLSDLVLYLSRLGTLP